MLQVVRVENFVEGFKILGDFDVVFSISKEDTLQTSHSVASSDSDLLWSIRVPLGQDKTTKVPADRDRADIHKVGREPCAALCAAARYIFAFSMPGSVVAVVVAKP